MIRIKQIGGHVNSSTAFCKIVRPVDCLNFCLNRGPFSIPHIEIKIVVFRFAAQHIRQCTVWFPNIVRIGWCRLDSSDDFIDICDGMLCEGAA